MSDLQNWFAPLLWIIAAITAIVGFIKLIKPIFTIPSEFGKRLESMEKRMNEHYEKEDEERRLTKENLAAIEKKVTRCDEIQLSLLHDSIAQIYHTSRAQGRVKDSDYHRACELYRYNGCSDYIETLMKSLEDMYRNQHNSADD